MFLLLTMRNATAWDGDDALYIMNARNIVLGLPYAHTGYIVNPDNVINPAAYPPGLPLLLAPIYWLYGVSFIKMKALCVVCFAAFIAVFCRMLLLYVPPILALATAAALGFHPFIWDFKDTLYSELPFMLACYAALLLIHRAQTTLRPSVPLLLGAAVLLAAAYLIRTVGIVLFPAALLAAVLLPKRAIAATFAVAAAAGLLAWTVQRFFPPDIGTYVGYFKDFSLQGVRTAVLRYLEIKRTLIGSAATSARPHIALVLTVAAALLISVGFLHRLRRVTVVEIFFIGYWALLFTYPISLEQGRYSLPVWPLIFLYFATGLSLVMQWLGRRGGRLFTSLVFGAVLVCYVAQFRIEFSVPIPYPIEAPESRAMFEAVRKEVPRDAV
ncbi:MAG: hypothetical protein JOZ11_11940, partial [Alphaproteobacteria bacterium]|nr:hypothetical protein [Alphaproteobacteria bacterium]